MIIYIVLSIILNLKYKYNFYYDEKDDLLIYATHILRKIIENLNYHLLNDKIIWVRNVFFLPILLYLRFFSSLFRPCKYSFISLFSFSNSKIFV